MRIALTAFLCLASPALADTFTIRSAPNSVTVYSHGAKVTRVLSVDLPAGTHTVVLPDLPPSVEWQLPQISIANATLGPVSVRDNALQPLPDAESEEIQTARDEVKARKAALTDHLDKEAEIHLRSEAAKAKIAFLQGLGKNRGLSTDISNLSDMVSLVGEKTLQARQQVLEAEKAIREMSEAREELEEELQGAEEALVSLLTADEDRVQATITVSTDADTTADLSVSYFVPAYWQPLYDVSLTQTGPAKVSIKRGAAVAQESGEDWKDVALTLSTLSISTGTAPSDIRPEYLWIYEPEPPKVAASSDSENLAEPIVEAPVIVEESQFAGGDYDGPGVSYVFPSPVSVANNVDAIRIALDTLEFEAEVFAQAVPLWDETAYLMARFKNTSLDPFFETDQALYSLDNTFVGGGEMPEIPAGGEGTLAFGPIEDLRLDRVVLKRNEGDSGLISRSNTREEEVRISVKNLGTRSWPVELLDRVAFSDQEDLVITYSSTPKPDIRNRKDERGILQWNLELAPGSKQSISLKQNIQWPEDMLLR